VQEFEREPSHQELAELLSITPKEVSSMLQGGGKHVSFDAPISDDQDSSTMLDLLSTSDEMQPDLKLMEESLRVEVIHGLSILSPREIEVLNSFYGLNGNKALNLEEIGDLYGLTRERVRQIKERAIRRLRKSFTRKRLQSYL
jgi:RNA polymerase primary sigma factor